MDSRNKVLNMLLEVDSGSFSNEVIKKFQDEQWDSRDRAFIIRLFYGTIEKRIWLDFIIDLYANTKGNKMKPVIRNILRMSLYQMFFMDSVPVHSAIDEGVKLTKRRGLVQLSGFVNGTLRTILREDFPRVPGWVEYNVPQWIYRKLVFDFSADWVERFLTYINERDPRITIVAMKPEAVQILESEGCQVTPLDEKIGCYRLADFDRLTDLKAYKEGLFYVQDVNSVRVAYEALKAAPEARLVLDLCAAPGGKSIIAAKSLPDARIISRDLSEDKVNVIRANASRLGLKNIVPEVFDALEFDDALKGQADLVIADLPCSGLGVIGRKPDIKYRVQPEDIQELAGLQKNILKVAAGYVKDGGVLAYSTCTFAREENEENVSWIKENLNLELIESNLFSPIEGDCLFVATFRKVAGTEDEN